VEEYWQTPLTQLTLHFPGEQPHLSQQRHLPVQLGKQEPSWVACSHTSLEMHPVPWGHVSPDTVSSKQKLSVATQQAVPEQVKPIGRQHFLLNCVVPSSQGSHSLQYPQLGLPVVVVGVGVATGPPEVGVAVAAGPGVLVGVLVAGGLVGVAVGGRTQVWLTQTLGEQQSRRGPHLPFKPAQLGVGVAVAHK
jgi:hypothetical protein